MPLMTAPDTAPTTIGAAILNLLLPHHRTTDPNRASAEDFPHQLHRITDFVREGAPVVLTLPGFPCKSPNPAKTLGHLPDMGERLSSPSSTHCAARSRRSTHPAPASSSAPTATSSVI